MLIMRLKPYAHAEHVLNMISPKTHPIQKGPTQIDFDGVSNSEPKFLCLGPFKARFQNRTEHILSSDRRH